MASKKSGKTGAPKSVETLTHEEAKRKNIPTAEYQSVMQKEAQDPLRVAYERRNKDLDPQLVWRGKDNQDWSDLVVQAPPLYIQEKVHPKALIDDLLRDSKERDHEAGQTTADLFSDFNGIPKGVDKTEFYQHDQNWSNRMILGDSLQVMASLAEREGLRGKVQCIYFDPPYGIKFNSNFQWSTTSRDVKDGNTGHITREPEQVKAFRDTWRDGIHSYLTYLRDRLTVARDLLCDSGSIFVQIGDENVHRVRAVMDEVFGEDNVVSQIAFMKTTGTSSNSLPGVFDSILWYARKRDALKYRLPLKPKDLSGEGGEEYKKVLLPDNSSRSLSAEERQDPTLLDASARIYRVSDLTSQSPGTRYSVNYRGKDYFPSGYWKTQETSMSRLMRAERVEARASSLGYRRFYDDYGALITNNLWTDTRIAGRPGDKIYVVQTTPKVIERCLLMATDPGDLVLDPTCGAGTTATVAEQWGRRWITIDTSRVALALARARIMGSRYPFYLLSDSREGQLKEAEITRSPPSSRSVQGNVRHGFVYERVSHITLKSIANNIEIDIIWDRWQAILDPLREQLNGTLMKSWQEWEVVREADPKWPESAKKVHAEWWRARIARQREIDASIAGKAEFEHLYDKPHLDNRKVRVAGPFTVESLSPHWR
jgi:adenine-specific DNA-methyltransferase